MIVLAIATRTGEGGIRSAGICWAGASAADTFTTKSARNSAFRNELQRHAYHPNQIRGQSGDSPQCRNDRRLDDRH
jgi:hypothetical protein